MIRGRSLNPVAARKRDDSGAIPQTIQPFGPMLHQPHAVRPVLRPVIDCAGTICIDVRKLQFDNIRVPYRLAVSATLIV
jgi:hypothetical protein